MTKKLVQQRISSILLTGALLAFAGPSMAAQDFAPVNALKDIYLDGLHVQKGNLSHQMEAHHFCHIVSPDFTQCVIFDGDTAQAHLIGVEYMISKKLFDTLSPKEQRYWHPHNYEILSGELIAPGLSSAAEHKAMAGKINSYGKTFQLWNTGSFEHKGDKLPLDNPELMWSFNREGEERPGLVENRDKRLGVDIEKVRRSRQDLLPLAKPQAGVNVLTDYFTSPTKPIPGVTSKWLHESKSAQ